MIARACIPRILSPNRAVSARTAAGLAAAQGAIAFALWARSPFDAVPRPGEVVEAFVGLWTGHALGRELLTSFLTNLEALAIAAVLSLGLAWGTVLPVMRPIAAAVSKGRFLGLTGLPFFFTLALGGGRPLKLALLVFATTVFATTAMAAEVAAIPRERFDHARTLRMSEWRVTWEVVIRGTSHRALEVLRQNAAISWTLLTMVEGFARADGGAGVLLADQNKHFHLADVFAIQLCILVVGLAQDAGLARISKLACPWAHLPREGSLS